MTSEGERCRRCDRVMAPMSDLAAEFTRRADVNDPTPWSHVIAAFETLHAGKCVRSGGMCEGVAVDWRARALTAESALTEQVEQIAAYIELEAEGPHAAAWRARALAADIRSGAWRRQPEGEGKS